MSVSVTTAVASVSHVRPDESLLAYPAAARLTPDGQAWDVPVHGSVVRPAIGGLMNGAFLSILRRYARLKRVQALTANFQSRARAFLADNLPHREIFVRIGERTHYAGMTGRNGHFHATIRVPVSDAVPLLSRASAENNGHAEPWLSWEAVLEDDDSRRVVGRTQLLATTGVSVVTDVDDTIKISEVAHRRTLLLNTFVKPYFAVPGMAEVFQRWAMRGAAFHYVSASPWQLFAPLDEFLSNRGFPPGAWEMKFSNWKTAPVRRLFTSNTAYKTGKIEPLLKAFPRRRFIFVGDSGQHDPEAYGQLARAYPRQVAGIFIRNLSDDDLPSKRMKNAFAGVPEHKWKVFRAAEELTNSEIGE